MLFFYWPTLFGHGLWSAPLVASIYVCENVLEAEATHKFKAWNSRRFSPWTAAPAYRTPQTIRKLLSFKSFKEQRSNPNTFQICIHITNSERRKPTRIPLVSFDIQPDKMGSQSHQKVYSGKNSRFYRYNWNVQCVHEQIAKKCLCTSVSLSTCFF